MERAENLERRERREEDPRASACQLSTPDKISQSVLARDRLRERRTSHGMLVIADDVREKYAAVPLVRMESRSSAFLAGTSERTPIPPVNDNRFDVKLFSKMEKLSQ